jgi:hypothetical protein
MKKRLSLITATIITGSALLAQSATTVSIGGTYSEGTYGTDKTTQVYYMPLTTSYQNGMFSASATVPYLKIDSEGSFTWTQGGAVPTTNPITNTNNVTTFPSSSTTSSSSTQTEGLGDVVLNIGYTFVPASGLYLKTSAIMKVATADETKGLGTGENDYSAQVDIYKMIGNAYIYVSAGYTLVGDTNTTDFNNVAYGSAALGYNFTKSFAGGINYSHRQAQVTNADDTQTASTYFSYKLGKTTKATLSYAKGLSDTAADNSYTFTLAQKF